MMSLGRELLGTIRRRKPQELLQVRADMTKQERHEMFVENVKRSVIPRRIRYLGDGFELSMTAANRRLYAAEVKFDTENLSFDFTDHSDTEELEALIGDFNRVLFLLGDLRFPSELEFDQLDGDFREEIGIAPDRLVLISGIEDAAEETKTAPVKEKQAKKAAADKPAKAAQKAPVEKAKTKKAAPEPANATVSAPAPEASVNAPFEFLDLTRDHARTVSYFSVEGEKAYDNARPNDLFDERENLPSFTTWYDKVAPVLGPNLVAVLVPVKAADDLVAMALNDKHGTGIEFQKRNLGHVCRIALSGK